MSRSRAAGASLVVALGLLVAACSGSAATPGSATSAGGGGSTASAGAGGGTGAYGAGGGTGGGGDLSKVDACKLLSPAEIQQALGVAFGNGINQDSDIVRQCEWDGNVTAGLTVGVTVRTFTDSDWQTIQAFPKASPVSGMGDAAYRNSPLTGDLSVKHDGYEIDMGIVNFTTMSQAQVDQATDTLMKLILSRT